MAGSEGRRRRCTVTEEQGGSSDGSQKANLQETVPPNKAQQQLSLPLNFHDDGECDKSYHCSVN